MFEESKPGVNLPLILALVVVALVAAVASAVVVRRKSDERAKKVQAENEARMKDLEKTLLQCKAELQNKSDRAITLELPLSSN